MTKIMDAPLRSAVPSGGYVLISEPVAAGSPLSTFAKVPSSALGSGGGSADLSNALLSDHAADGSGGSSGSITSEGMAAWFATLPLVPPSTAGQPWNNGGTLAFSY